MRRALFYLLDMNGSNFYKSSVILITPYRGNTEMVAWVTVGLHPRRIAPMKLKTFMMLILGKVRLSKG